LGKIKKDIEIVWEDTNHEWNKFGEIIVEELSELKQKELEAKAGRNIAKNSFRRIIEKVGEANLGWFILRNY